jgi:integrase/recombinase XerD
MAPARDLEKTARSKNMDKGIKVLACGRIKLNVYIEGGEGKRVRRRKTLPPGSTMEDARREREAMIAEVVGRRPETPPADLRLLLGEYAWAWYRRRLPRLKPSTAAKYEEHLRLRIIPVLGDLYADALRRSDLEEWVTWAEEQRTRGGRYYTHASLMGWWGVLSTLAKDLAADLGIPDPTARILPPRGRGTAHRDTHALSHEQLGALLEAARGYGPGRYAEVCTLAYTGMRAGELYALHWEDVGRDELLVHRAVSKGELLDSTKTGAPRSVYVPPELGETLAAWRSHMIQHQHRGLASGLVFPSDFGGVRTAASLRKALRAMAEVAGLEVSVSPQTMRRTYNTLLLAAGVDRIVLRSQMGHTTEAMTRRYAGVSLELKRAGFEQAFGGGVTSPDVTPPRKSDTRGTPSGVDA